ncbi:MAG: MFS transporter [Bacteroidales bacterium]
MPILSGAIADRYGYKKTLLFSFVAMSLGYYFAGLSTEYFTMFASLILMAVGAGFFKPNYFWNNSRETNKENSSLVLEYSTGP